MTDKRVERSFSRHLPFEPDPDAEEFKWREELRQSLRVLRADKDEILCACYAAPELPSGSDVENLVFYNIGASYFRPCCKQGIRFEWKRNPCGSDPRYTYRLTADGRFAHTRTEPEPLASWNGIKLQSINGDTRAGLIWRDIKRMGKDAIKARKEPHCGYFAVTAKLEGDVGGKNPTAIVKPLFDGIILALAQDSGRNRGPVLVSLSRLLGEKPEIITQWLDETRSAVLGKYPLFRKDGVGNPPDNRCIAGELLLVQSEGDLVFSGALYAAEPGS